MNEKWRMFLELQFLTYMRIFFDHCHVTFQYKEVLSLFGHCHVTCLKMEPQSFFAKFVRNILASCFSDSFDQKTTQQSDDSCNATCCSQLLRNVLKKQFFQFCKFIWKIYCEQRLLHCPPRWQRVLFTKVQVSHINVRKCWRVTTETGPIVFHISTP